MPINRRMKCEDGCPGNRVLSVQQVASVLNLEFLTDPILLFETMEKWEVARFRGRIPDGKWKKELLTELSEEFNR